MVNINKIVSAEEAVVDRPSHYKEETGIALYKYIKSISAMNKGTAHEYYARLIN